MVPRTFSDGPYLPVVAPSTGRVARLLPAAVASPHAVHLLLGTNAVGNEGARTIADALVPGHGLKTLYLGSAATVSTCTGGELLSRPVTRHRLGEGTRSAR